MSKNNIVETVILPGDREHRRVRHPGGGESKVQQSARDASDINTIVARWRKDHVVPMTPGKRPMYGDFTTASDFQETLHRLHMAEEEFLALPSAVRNLCDNDPGKFLDLVHQEEGLKALVDVGFAPELAPETAPVQDELRMEGGQPDAPQPPQEPAQPPTQPPSE